MAIIVECILQSENIKGNLNFVDVLKVIVLLLGVLVSFGEKPDYGNPMKLMERFECQTFH